GVSLAHPHFLARVSGDVCTGCGLCAEVCNTHAHGIFNGSHSYDSGKCIGCGLCVEACPVQAIIMEENPVHESPSKSWPSLWMRILPATVLSMLRAKFGRADAHRI
ncbi:MAG TPA: 4Fe-4S binding protein, partial [Deltaproteobacteria bacterium]|nr:4Fe-4S binding protein [Deltaproteobacteria bacterium]